MPAGLCARFSRACARFSSLARCSLNLDLTDALSCALSLSHTHSLTPYLSCAQILPEWLSVTIITLITIIIIFVNFIILFIDLLSLQILPEWFSVTIINININIIIIFVKKKIDLLSLQILPEWLSLAFPSEVQGLVEDEWIRVSYLNPRH